jgi:hypothetical protein
MNAFLSHLESELKNIKDSGLWKEEAEITSPRMPISHWAGSPGTISISVRITTWD